MNARREQRQLEHRFAVVLRKRELDRRIEANIANLPGDTSGWRAFQAVHQNAMNDPQWFYRHERFGPK